MTRTQSKSHNVSQDMEALAWEITSLMEDIDHYAFHDAYDSVEEGMEETMSLLRGPIGRSTIANTLQGFIDDDALMPDQEARARAVLGKLAAMNGGISNNIWPRKGVREKSGKPMARPGKAKVQSGSSKSAKAGTKRLSGLYVGVFQEPDGISFTVPCDPRTLRNEVLPRAVQQRPYARFLKVITVEEKDHVVEQCRKRGCRVE